MFSRKALKHMLMGALVSSFAGAITLAHAETLRLLTWANYAPPEVVKMFEAKYPNIHVEVTLSNNEEMIAKLRATGGSGWDLAQPSDDRVNAAQREYNIYKPLDLSKIDLKVLDPQLLKAAEANTTIDGKVYSIPFEWGTAGLVVNTSVAPNIKRWTDLCDPQYKGKVSMRLRRIILIGMGFSMGYDPFAAYHDKAQYAKILKAVEQKLIACKSNVYAYWHGGDQLVRMMLSGNVIASGTWDSTAYRLHSLDSKFEFVPPTTGALAWVDTFTIPRNGQNSDAVYKWINFAMQPKIQKIISSHSGAVPAVQNGGEYMVPKDRAAFKAAFTKADLKHLKFFPNVPPGLEAMEGKVLDQIKAAQ